MAGFRVRESVLGISNDVVGRTSAVTGTVIVSGDQVTGASFRIDLTTIKVNGKTQPQFATSLDTRLYPVATVILARPVTLGPAFASGATISVTVTGRLTMHGVSRLVTFTISGRRDGTDAAAHRVDPGRLLRLGHHRADRIRLPRLARQPRHGRVPADPQPALTARWPRLAAVAEAGETVLSRSSCRVDASSTSFARAETHLLPAEADLHFVLHAQPGAG